MQSSELGDIKTVLSLKLEIRRSEIRIPHFLFGKLHDIPHFDPIFGKPTLVHL
jgi:hypothetical protein